MSATGPDVETWDPSLDDVLRLPSGALVRGRAIRSPAEPRPTFGLYLLGRRPPHYDWETRWVRWRDFGLPADTEMLAEALREALQRAGTERVEFSCLGGRGRTGTALACLAVLDGVPNEDAVEYVRAGYRREAVETAAQERFVQTFDPGPA